MTAVRERAHGSLVMEGRSGQEAGVALRTLARFGLHEGVPAYVALLIVVTLVLLVLNLVRED